MNAIHTFTNDNIVRHRMNPSDVLCSLKFEIQALNFNQIIDIAQRAPIQNASDQNSKKVAL